MKLFIKILLVIIFSLLSIVIAVILFFKFIDNHSIILEGSSMEPNYHNGDTLFFNPIHLSPKIGDAIIFDCLANKCMSSADTNIEGRFKRITAINDNCYWVEGDNRLESNDSNDYGWLCPSDISSVETVIFKF